MAGSRDTPLPDRKQFHTDFLATLAQTEAALDLVDHAHRAHLERSLERSGEWGPGHGVASAFDAAAKSAAEVEGEADASGATATAFVAHAALELAASASAAAMMEDGLAGGTVMGAWTNYRNAQASLGVARASVVIARLLATNAQIDPPVGGWKLLLRRHDYPSSQALAFAQELAESLGLPRPWRLGKIHPQLAGPLLAWVSKGEAPAGVLPRLPSPATSDHDNAVGNGREMVEDEWDDEELEEDLDDTNEPAEGRMDELATVLAHRIRSEDGRSINNVAIHVTTNDITLGPVRDAQRQELDVRWGMRLLQPEVSELADLVDRSFDISFTDGGAYCFPHDEEDALARLLADRIRAQCPRASSVDIYVTPAELQVGRVDSAEFHELQVDWGIRLLLPEIQQLADLVGSSFTLYIDDDGAAFCVPDDSLESVDLPDVAPEALVSQRRRDRHLRAQPHSRHDDTDNAAVDESEVDERESDPRIDELVQQLGERIRALGPDRISSVIISSTGRKSWVSGIRGRVPSSEGDDYDNIEDLEIDWDIRDLRPMVTELIDLIGGSFAVHFSRDGTVSRGIVL